MGCVIGFGVLASSRPSIDSVGCCCDFLTVSKIDHDAAPYSVTSSVEVELYVLGSGRPPYDRDCHCDFSTALKTVRDAAEILPQA